MKKVLSIVLAVMMLSTLAFAAAAPALTGNVTPGETYSVVESDFKDDADGTTPIPTDSLKDDTTTTPGTVIPMNFEVRSSTWTKGRTLVDTVKIDKTNGVVNVALKANYTLNKDTDLEGKITLVEKKVASGVTKKTYTAVVTSVVVNNDEKTFEFTERNEEQYLYGPAANTIYKIEAKNYGSGTLYVQDSDFEYVGRVYDKDKFYLASDSKVDKDVIKANEDVEADYINFINFPARPEFKSAGTLKFLIEKSDNVYEVKDGKLTALKGTWNSDDGCYEVKGVKTLGSYVYSDAKLKSAPASDKAPTEGTNPDTGANDVVGIAAALAAVALVSAAAVSLKK